MRVVHEGRGGYLEIEGRQLAIEHIDAGHFCIHLPSAEQLEPSLLETLKAFAAAQDPSWHVEDKCTR